MASVLEIIPLGGIGEFGMNCMAVRYGDEMLILDAGMGFPEETAYGVDVSIRISAFLDEYKDDITAIVLTHGHEDHLGRLPYLLKRFNVPGLLFALHLPVWRKANSKNTNCSATCCSIASNRETSSTSASLRSSSYASHIRWSTAFSLGIKTPVGTIIHTGDYKVDETPVIGEPIDLRSVRRYGQDGVLRLLSDSTNATVPGRTPSERAVIPAFEEIFSEAQGRIIVAAFRVVDSSFADRARRGAAV
jgi:ribonuclease J